jgi:hypothetical protein
MADVKRSFLLVALAVFGLSLSACRTPPSVPARLDAIRPIYPNVFFLQFDHSGTLMNLTEVERLTDRLRVEDVSRVVVLSFGWYNSHNDYPHYIRYLGAHANPEEHGFEGLPTLRPSALDDQSVVICILWDARFSVFRRLLNDFLPSARLADTLAFVPDHLLFPFSFWAKASLADKIGLHELRETMEVVYAEAATREDRGPPPLYLIGHSFGCRVLCSLVKPPSSFRENVRGMVLLQAAMNEVHAPDARHVAAPVIMTFSRHDNANRALYPLGTLPFNSGASDFGEAMETVLEERGVRRVTRLHQPGFNMLWNLLRLPLSYLRTQAQQIIEGPHDYLLDTLAQIPVINYPIYRLGALRDGPPWGEQRRGLFSLGWANESVGAAPPILTPKPLPTPDWSRLEGKTGARRLFAGVGMWGATVGGFFKAMFVGYEFHESHPTMAEVLAPDYAIPNGHLHVDATTVIQHAMPKAKRWRWPMDAWYSCVFLNWFNPVGSHVDFLEPEVFQLVDKVIGLEREAPPAE